MKNIINYYYNIIVNDFKKRDNSFIFYINENKYEFTEFYGNVNEVNKIYSIVNFYNKICDEIILNKEQSILTYYENVPYILLKKIYCKEEKMQINDIINYDSLINIRDELRWKKLWGEKLDYYELLLNQMKQKFFILKESFNYYLGLSELAINLLNYVNYKNVRFHISHKRIDKKNDLYNPLNIIIDSKVRDIAEYIKISFFNDEINEDEIIQIIISNIIEKDEIILLFARLIYPSYYFDIYENIYNQKSSEKELNKIIKKNAIYEAFLKKIYNNIKFIYNLPQIEFLEY